MNEGEEFAKFLLQLGAGALFLVLWLHLYRQREIECRRKDSEIKDLRAKLEDCEAWSEYSDPPFVHQKRKRGES